MEHQKSNMENGENERNNTKAGMLLFDLDGTLTDSGEGILKSVKMVLEHYGIPLPSEREMWRFIGPPLRKSFSECGIPEEELENAVQRCRTRYFAVGKFENVPYSGIRELLVRLKADGYRLYVATSKAEDLAVEILRHFDLADLFDCICGASIDRSLDSKEKVIARLFEETGRAIAEETVVMIGDTEFDILGAKAHGIPAIGVAWGYGEVEKMREAGALRVVSSPDELYETITEILPVTKVRNVSLKNG